MKPYHELVTRDSPNATDINKVDYIPIKRIIDSGLCIGCGACITGCNGGTLELKKNYSQGIYTPEPNTSCAICTNLEARKNKPGNCVSVCPGIEIDFSQKTQNYGGYHPVIGNYRRTVIADSTNQENYIEGSSSGVITTLASFFLEQNLVTGCFLTMFNVHQGEFNTVTEIVTDSEKVKNYRGSIYFPSSAANLPITLRRKSGNKYVFIGLPCQISGVKKLEEKYPRIKAQIALKIAIVCSHFPNFHALDFLLYQHKINKNKITGIKFRGKGFPGKMTVQLDNQEVEIPFPQYWDKGFGKWFKHRRCRLCIDPGGEDADIVVGDFWARESLTGEEAKTGVIIRTKRGEEYFQKGVKKGVIVEKPVSPEQLLNSIRVIERKKRATYYRIQDKLGKPVPEYYDQVPNTPLKIWEILQVVTESVMIKIASCEFFWPGLKYYIVFSEHVRKMRKYIITQIKN